MDIKKLEQNHEQLINHLEEAGYSSGYIYRFKIVIRYILENNDSQEWGSYADIYESYKTVTTSQHVLNQVRAILSGIQGYHLYNRYPGDGKRYALLYSDPLEDLLPEFKGLIIHYRKEAQKSRKKEKTIYIESSCGITFLKSMQANSCMSLKEITENYVLDFFLADGVLARSRSYVKNLSAVFKAGLTFDECSCRNVLFYLPKIHRGRKNIQYLTEDEVSKIKSVIESSRFGLSLRDRAIGLILIHYGLRRSDITGLLLDSIDWDKSMLRIKQQKTDYPMELPLIPVVGNAIFDYITKERGNSNLPYVFLTERVPVRNLCGNGTVNGVVDKILKHAGLRQNPGDRRGTHIFRHHFATKLMSGGIAQPVISHAMGHSLPDSVETYLSADFVHLKACALSIADYPVAEEVLHYEI